MNILCDNVVSHRKPRIYVSLLILASVLPVALAVGQPPGFEEASATDVSDLAELRHCAVQLRDQVTELAGADDLIDTLHHAWFDRPYARATLAVLVKTTAALEREVSLRELGNGAIRDATVRDMLSWANEAIERVIGSTSQTGFRPHRMSISATDLISSATHLPLFAFVDRATATRHHQVFGDLDLQAAMGQRFYCRVAGDLGDSDAARRISARASDLGMAVVALPSPRRTVEPPGRVDIDVQLPLRVLRPQPFACLQELVTSRLSETQQTAILLSVADPSWRESWPAFLARRALVRGANPVQSHITVDWNTPWIQGSRGQATAAIRAAVWVHAIEDRSPFLISGWRDLRDGSAVSHPSLFVNPRKVEAISHAALDVLRWQSAVQCFSSTPILAIVVDSTSIDAGDENRWADWTQPIWEGLVRRQISYDVIPKGAQHEPLRRGYRVVYPLGDRGPSRADSVLRRIERLLGVHPEHINRVTCREHGGAVAPDVLVREGRTEGGGRCVALVNLSGEPRSLKLRGGPKLGVMRDLVTGDWIEEPSKLVWLAEWQVRLLWPAD